MESVWSNCHWVEEHRAQSEDQHGKILVNSFRDENHMAHIDYNSILAPSGHLLDTTWWRNQRMVHCSYQLHEADIFQHMEF